MPLRDADLSSFYCYYRDGYYEQTRVAAAVMVAVNIWPALTDPDDLSASKGPDNAGTDQTLRREDQRSSKMQPRKSRISDNSRLNWWARPDSNRGPSGFPNLGL